MGRIVISENVSLDGVIEIAAGEEDSRFGRWFEWMTAEDRDAWAGAEYEEALGAEALLMGRRSYEWFVARGWASRTGAWADRLRSLPKHVVSSSAVDLAWDNTSIVKGDAVEEISALKQQVKGDIVVYASGRLVQTLIEHDLADELRLMVYPFVLGAGERLFGETSDKKPMRLVGTRMVGDGIPLLTYRAVPKP
ncbi:dihydrofolate reductase family protein [Actinomadura opuntiae]|uniref:dihydrofolate reductase family protein n=1 Tax=Actinomadura sp. OS1-43 TaxID=604315 RepID=UPI00255ADF14|nr:dihydrofolate reductase family protein [Actinomadura sp. OS1-43]MDL4816825.1 dihydrofolate reductase family protein [Actinomadura sp. OS1-43]